MTSSTMIERNIETHSTFWRVYDTTFEVRYGVPALDLSRKLFLESSQVDHIQRAIQARASGGFGAASMSCYHDIFRALYFMCEEEYSACEVEKARKFLERTMDTRDLATLTHMVIGKRSPDRVIQNYGLLEQSEEKITIVNESDRESLGPPKICHAILGSEDVEETENIYSWLRPERAPRFCLPDSRWDYDYEDIVKFEDNTCWGIIGSSSQSFAYSALGVRFVTPEVLKKEQWKVVKPRAVLPVEWQGKDIEIAESLQQYFREDEIHYRLSLAEQGGHLSPEKARIVRKIFFAGKERAKI